MFLLKQSLNAWGGSDFKRVIKNEIENLNTAHLPLQQGLSQGSYVCDSSFHVMLISVSEEHDYLHAKTGIFYSSIIAGCGCADDPSSVDELAEYCVLQFAINRKTAETTATFLRE